jgi:hypothetical protein
MSQVSGSISEEERSLFRPFTRESLVAIEVRIAEELAKQKELEKKRAEGEVSSNLTINGSIFYALYPMNSSKFIISLTAGISTYNYVQFLDLQTKTSSFFQDVSY